VVETWWLLSRGDAFIMESLDGNMRSASELGDRNKTPLQHLWLFKNLEKL
jgi:hypothetical protein